MWHRNRSFSDVRAGRAQWITLCSRPRMSQFYTVQAANRSVASADMKFILIHDTKGQVDGKARRQYEHGFEEPL